MRASNTKNPFNTSLKTRLTALFLIVSLVPLNIIIYITLVNTENSLKDRVFEQLKTTVSGRAATLELLIKLRIQQIQTIASTFIVQEYMNYFENKINDPSDNSELEKTLTSNLEKVLSRFQDITGGQTGFFDFKLIGDNGKVYYSTDQSLVGKDFSENPRFRQAILGESFLEYEFDKVNNAPLMVVTVPITSFDSAEQIGVIIATMGTTTTNSITTNREGLGETGEIILIDKDGTIMTKSRFIEDAEFKIKATTLAFQKCAQNIEIVDSFKDYRGVLVLEASNCFPQGWTMIAKIDQTEALAPVDNLRNITYTVLIISVLIVGIIAYLMSRSISKPILELKNVAHIISKGNFAVKANEDYKDEIGELGRSFNNMIESIKLNEELRVETETLRKTSKEKEEFAAMISHELKTPLVPIQGYSELLLKGRLGELNEMQKKSAKTIFDNAARLSRLIQDILDVRKMELGRLNLDIRNANAKEIIGQCLTAFKTTAQSKNITLVDNSQDIPIQCDPERIIQVLNNLLSNAFKFVPQENGKIELGAKTDNHSVIFSVKDNGIGIPKDKQDSLFKKFYQVDTTLGRKAGGSGLGLVICKGIIESHKGKIWIESEPGKGTIIYFSIPMEVI